MRMKRALLTALILLLAVGTAKSASEQQYEFKKSSPNKVSCALNQVTRLKLEPGEIVTGKPVISDSKSWKIGKAAGVVIVEPLQSKRVARLMIPTNKRTYLIDLSSDGEAPLTLVSWTYEHESDVKEAPANAIPPISPIKPIAAVTPTPTKEIWTINKGETLKSGLTKWVDRAGWSFLSWELTKDFPIVATITVSGDFKAALEAVLQAYHHSATPLYSCLKMGNKVVVITDKPVQDRCNG